MIKFAKAYIIRGARKLRAGYRATVGPIEGNGPTKADAALDVEAKVRAALNRLDGGVIVHKMTVERRLPLHDLRYPEPHYVCIYPTIYGYAYWMDLFSPGYTISQTGVSLPEVERNAVSHLAYGLWTLDTDDETFFAALPRITLRDALEAELRTWVKWQRDYAALMADGYSDLDARQILGGFMKRREEGPEDAVATT